MHMDVYRGRAGPAPNAHFSVFWHSIFFILPYQSVATLTNVLIIPNVSHRHAMSRSNAWILQRMGLDDIAGPCPYATSQLTRLGFASVESELGLSQPDPLKLVLLALLDLWGSMYVISLTCVPQGWRDPATAPSLISRKSSPVCPAYEYLGGWCRHVTSGEIPSGHCQQLFTAQSILTKMLESLWSIGW
ncbi:hypothetical protein BDW22DRAFT_911941 [Trametopsis cervina]|nr:hypothetical protein BDW22DRAFT_911941 [Trametopsis cervina]